MSRDMVMNEALDIENLELAVISGYLKVHLAVLSIASLESQDGPTQPLREQLRGRVEPEPIHHPPPQVPRQLLAGLANIRFFC